MSKKSIINIIIILVYAFITLFVIMHHEIWGDEAQAWLVVRDLDFWGIIKHVRTEGHPLLWYFLILPFAKLKFSVFSMQILNWLFMVAGAALLLWKAPFNYFCKISVLCSAGFLYWFPALARSYSLIPVLLFFLAIFYKKQKEHPYIYSTILILLANVHVIMLGFCSALFVLFIWENRKKEFIFPSMIMFSGILSVILYLYGAQNENLTVQNYHQILSLQLLSNTYKNIIFNIYGSIRPLYMWIFSIFCIATSILLLKQNRKMLFIFVTNFLFQFCIFLFIWGIIAQRAYLILLTGLFCLWITFEKLSSNKIKILFNIIIALTFFVSAKYALEITIKDALLNFSDGKNAAEYIKKAIPDDAFIISNSPITTSAISIYLPENKWKFYYEKYNSFYTYAIWNKVAPNPTDPLPITDLTAKYGTIYVLMSGNCYYTDIKPVYSSKNNVMMAQEKYYIYKFGK